MAHPKSSNFSSHVLLFLLLLLFIRLSSQSNSISRNNPLSGAQRLTSQGGRFALGFFQPGNSSYYYIGIWFNKVSQPTPVWVANRDTPITYPITAEFKISSSGNLVLSNQSNSLIWSTNTNITSNSTVAILLDTGNFVLQDESNPNITFWQSFDHPTDTWLPGSKLGVNKVTGELQQLISWKDSNDPAPGIYSLGIDLKGSSQYFIFWNNSKNYWTSGIWNGQIFAAVPEMSSHYLYSFQFISNNKESYFTYSISSSIVTRLIMDTSGQIKQLTWVENSQEWILFWSQPKLQCQVYALCGSFGSCNENAFPSCNCIRGFKEQSSTDWALSDRAGGCVRTTQLQCGKNSSAQMEKDRFLTMSNMRLPDNARSLKMRTAFDCELACLNNCSCTAYSFSRSGCSIWYEDLLNLQEQYTGQGSGTLFVRLPASELPSSKSKKGIVIRAIIFGVVGILALTAFVLFLIWWRRRIGMTGKPKTEAGLVAFRYSELQQATKNFSEKLGKGGFGAVFKGVLPDSRVIAVKKLEGLRQGEKQFRTEVSTIGMIQHVSLVQLHGFCSEGNNKLLVYEYMPNGSLGSQLFRNNSSNVLDWKKRYHIALGIAQGLTYLHEECRDCIIHCDIKPENILLDASFVPKVADFGLAKLLGHDLSRVLTTMRGTMGYLAPEWISGVAITAKADVYSYGMMLFEVISGERNWKQIDEEKHAFFPTFAARKLIEGDVKILVDHRLEGDAELEEVIRACKVACWCIQDDENSRPTMGQVVQILEGVLEVNVPPIPRALEMLAENPEPIAFFSESPSNGVPQSHGISSKSEATSLSVSSDN